MLMEVLKSWAKERIEKKMFPKLVEKTKNSCYVLKWKWWQLSNARPLPYSDDKLSLENVT